MTRRFCLTKWQLGDNRLWMRLTCVSIYPWNAVHVLVKKVLNILWDGTDNFTIFLVLIHSNSKWTENVTFPSQWLQNWWGQGYQDNCQQCTNLRGHAGSIWLWLQISKVPVSQWPGTVKFEIRNFYLYYQFEILLCPNRIVICMFIFVLFRF